LADHRKPGTAGHFDQIGFSGIGKTLGFPGVEDAKAEFQQMAARDMADAKDLYPPPILYA
jgi:hypothetical protein